VQTTFSSLYFVLTHSSQFGRSVPARVAPQQYIYMNPNFGLKTSPPLQGRGGLLIGGKLVYGPGAQEYTNTCQNIYKNIYFTLAPGRGPGPM
jgi:hypothetical protein